jgi:hypothetical protein
LVLQRTEVEVEVEVPAAASACFCVYNKLDGGDDEE